MQTFLHRRVVLASVATALVIATPARADTLTPARSTPALSVLRLLNAARAERGRPPLRRDRRLARVARRHSRDMVVHRYFAHESRTGERPAVRIARSGWMRGRRRWTVGENLAWGSGARADPPSIVAAWLRSPAHRRVLLDARFRVAGIGVAPGTPGAGAPGGLTYTADFGS